MSKTRCRSYHPLVAALTVNGKLSILSVEQRGLAMIGRWWSVVVGLVFSGNIRPVQFCTAAPSVGFLERSDLTRVFFSQFSCFPIKATSKRCFSLWCVNPFPSPAASEIPRVSLKCPRVGTELPVKDPACWSGNTFWDGVLVIHMFRSCHSRINVALFGLFSGYFICCFPDVWLLIDAHVVFLSPLSFIILVLCQDHVVFVFFKNWAMKIHFNVLLVILIVWTISENDTFV